MDKQNGTNDTVVNTIGLSKKIKPMAQKFCPVYSDTRVHPKSLSMEYKGKKIYFCKKRAMDRFKANPAKYAKNLKK